MRFFATSSIADSSNGTASFFKAVTRNSFCRTLGAGAGGDGRPASKKAPPHDSNFAFSGLRACHACGCAVVGEIKKERYVYYRCAGHADKCQGKPAPAGVNMCARRCLSTVPSSWAGSISIMRCWNGCVMRCTPSCRPAARARGGDQAPSGARGFKTASMRCTSINSTASLTRRSTIGCRTGGATS